MFLKKYYSIHFNNHIVSRSLQNNTYVMDIDLFSRAYHFISLDSTIVHEEFISIDLKLGELHDWVKYKATKLNFHTYKFFAYQNSIFFLYSSLSINAEFLILFLIKWIKDIFIQAKLHTIELWCVYHNCKYIFIGILEQEIPVLLNQIQTDDPTYSLLKNKELLTKYGNVYVRTFNFVVDDSHVFYEYELFHKYIKYDLDWTLINYHYKQMLWFYTKHCFLFCTLLANISLMYISYTCTQTTKRQIAMLMQIESKLNNLPPLHDIDILLSYENKND